MALVAALVGPFLVDWTAYRATFEQNAERLLGHKVRVLGEADATILPIPSLTFTDVRVGTAEDPLMTVERFAMRVELAPLLQGKIKVIDMRLEKPIVQLSLDESGRLDWMMGFGPGDEARNIDPDSVMLSDVDIKDGTVELTDARTGKVHKLTDINVALDATSLIGPFKMDGGARYNGTPLTMRIATGRRRDDGALRIKSDLVPANRPISLSLDGDLANNNGIPEYRGKFVISRVLDELISEDRTAAPWNANGTFDLSSEKLLLEKFKVSHGPQDRPYGLSGVATVTLGDTRRFDIVLSSKQIDLDRTLGAGPSKPANIQSAVAAIISVVRDLPDPQMSGRVGFNIPAIVVGGGIIQNVRLDAVTDKDGWRIEALESRLPGRTFLSSVGLLKLTDGMAFEGKILLRCEQPAAFFGWWQRGRKAGSASLDPFDVKGFLSASAEGIGISELTATTNNAKIIGSVTWQPDANGRKSAMTADLEANRLDLDQISTVIKLMTPAQRGSTEPTGFNLATDIAVHLVSDQLIVGGVTARGIDVAARLSGENVVFRKFEVADLAGARISAKGDIKNVLTAPDGGFEAAIKAADLSGLVTIIARVAPDSRLSQWMNLAAPALAPIDLKASLSARGTGEETKAKLALSGTAAKTNIKMTSDFTGQPANWRDGAIIVDAEIAGPDSVRMLRQAGLQLLPIDDATPGRIKIAAQGRVGDNVTIEADAEAVGISSHISGIISAPEGVPVRYDLDSRVTSKDLNGFALLTGTMAPALERQFGLTMSARMIGEGPHFDLTDITGNLADVPFSGDMNVDLKAKRGKIRGALDFDRLEFALVTQLNLGANAWTIPIDADPAAWPSMPFGPPVIDSIDADLRIKAKTLPVFDKYAVKQAVFDLNLREGTLSIAGFKGETLGGKVSGNLLTKRSGGEAVITGNVKLAGIAVDDIMWRRNDRPVITGIADISIDIEGNGRSVSAIVAGLSGRGAFSMRDGLLRYVNPRAFTAVMRAVDAGLELEDDKIRSAFAGHLDVGTLTFKEVAGVVAIASGTARARNISVDGDAATAFGSATLDLDAWRMRGDWTLKVDPGDNAVAGAEPQVGLVFEGPLNDPQRQIDIQPLTAFLTLRAFEKEVQRIEIMQADILERERFTRQLSRMRQAALRRERDRQAAEDATPPNDQPQAPADNTDPAPVKTDDPAAPPPRALAPVETPKIEIVTTNPDSNTPDKPTTESPDVSPAEGTDFANKIRAAIKQPENETSVPPLAPPIEIGPSVGAKPNDNTPKAPMKLVPGNPATAEPANDNQAPDQPSASARAVDLPGVRTIMPEPVAAIENTKTKPQPTVQHARPVPSQPLTNAKSTKKKKKYITQPSGRVVEDTSQ